MKNELTVMSFNVQSWDIVDRRKKGVVETIRKYNPDLVGLQEVNPIWTPIIEPSFEDEYFVLGLDRFYGVEKETYKESPWCPEKNTVLVKKERFELLDEQTLWLSESMAPGTKVEGAFYMRIFVLALLKDKITNKVFTFINTHYDHIDKNAIAVQSEVLLSFLKKGLKTPVVFCGDLNSHPEDKAYRILAECYRDLRLDFPKEDNGPTYHAYGRDGAGTIDYIFTDDSFVHHDFKIIKDTFEGLPPSDHYAIFGKISLKD